MELPSGHDVARCRHDLSPASLVGQMIKGLVRVLCRPRCGLFCHVLDPLHLVSSICFLSRMLKSKTRLLGLTRLSLDSRTSFWPREWHASTLLGASRPKGLGERHDSAIFHQQHLLRKATSSVSPTRDYARQPHRQTSGVTRMRATVAYDWTMSHLTIVSVKG
jgi:hypothetical protein